MRFFGTFILLSILSISSVHALEIKKVRARYIEDESFQLISEYFTAVEGGQKDWLVARSSSARRSGYYFIVSFDKPMDHIPKGSRAEIEWVPGGESPREVTTLISIPDRRIFSYDVYLGITGNDWAFAEQKPIAWKITIKDASGRELAKKKSFLWGED